jgi:Uma2 family endonuclease
MTFDGQLLFAASVRESGPSYNGRWRIADGRWRKEVAMTTVTAPANVKTRWTAAKYLSISSPDDGNLYEVLDGELIMAAAPNLRHQEIIFRIAKLIDAFVLARKTGKVFIAAVDVVLGDDLVEPDVVFVSNERKGIMGTERITGAPDLVVEVLSLSTSTRDLRYKWDLYARSGVTEYWVVNPEAETVEVLTLVDGVYQRHVLAEKDGSLTSKVLEGFSASAADVFAE